MLAMAKFFANSQTREVKANYLQIIFQRNSQIPRPLLRALPPQIQLRFHLLLLHPGLAQPPRFRRHTSPRITGPHTFKCQEHLFPPAPSGRHATAAPCK